MLDFDSISKKRVCPFARLQILQGRGRSIVYTPAFGNLGDAIINLATLQLFDQFSIKYTIFDSKANHHPSNLYVLAGGGYLTSFYPEYSKSLLPALLESIPGSDLFILPGSFSGIDEFVSKYGKTMHIWARDYQSLEYLVSLGHENSFIYDDIGLFLDVDHAHLSQFHALRLLRRFALSPSSVKSANVLNCFRKDHESLESFTSISRDRSSTNLDFSPACDVSLMWDESSGLSRGFGYSYLDYGLLCNTVSWFLSYLDMFDIVRTDRLHVAIASLLLGKQVHMYDNSYGKLSAVYSYSLSYRSDFCVSITSPFLADQRRL